MHIGIDGSRCGTDRPTGVERYARLLLAPLTNVLLKAGHRVTVYTSRPLGFLPAEVHERVIRIPRLWTHLGLGPVAIADRVDRLFVPAHVLPVLRPRRCVVTLHDACAEEVPAAYSLWERWYLRLTTADALRSARVIAHSETAKSMLLRRFGELRAPITVVRPAPPPFRTGNVSPPWPRPYLVSIGRIEERKNLSVLLAAFDLLLHRRPDLRHHLVLLGPDGTGAHRIHAFRKRLAHAARIHMAGYVADDVRDASLFGAAGVVHPTLCEGWSFVLQEARAAGVPFAASGHPACLEAGGTAGVVVADPHSAEAWVRALSVLIDQPPRPQPAGAELTWDQVARDVAAVLGHGDP